MARFENVITAIGASAGGLEALERFFRNCPVDTGSAFVVIQHLSPDYKSMMNDLLGRYTTMPVQVVEEGMALRANEVFLIPAGSVMRIADGKFQLTPKSPHQLSLPIDIFFNSLATEHGSKSIGIILSGTGSDGTRGAASLSAEGGILMAQEPKDARFDGMPASVIATGLVDVILPADQLGQRLMSFFRDSPLKREEIAPKTMFDPASPEEIRDEILQLLLQSGGIDFRDYKQATVSRRLERRMQLRHQSNAGDYLLLLKQDRDELSVLRREMLIPVTSFFRDPEAFETLRKDVVQPVVDRLPAGETVRVWVAGCSTGEEAYGIAMLFLEAFEERKRWPALKVFATDVNQINIDFASAGHYPLSAAAELSPERIDRFFQMTDRALVVKPELRQSIVFACHNLLADPPFTRMSLVSCRNTLIYFTSAAQRRALQRLTYAMNADGFLFLGSSESGLGHAEGLSALHGKHKIFQRTGAQIALSTGSDSSARGAYALPPKRIRPLLGTRQGDPDNVDRAMHMLIEDFAPASMLVNERHEIVHMFGDVSPFFRMGPGVPSLVLNKVLPENLRPVASALLFKARKSGERLSSDLLRMPADPQGERAVRLIVRPVASRADDPLLLLSFHVQAHGEWRGTITETVDVDIETAARLDILERELQATRESLQATIEELETSNEELQSTNEELMASNEELQSSNEELQSVNEELNTVNAEFHEKMSILNRANADLDNMVKAVGVATIFVDSDMHLTRFSPDAAMIFKMRDGDIGRPLDEIGFVLRFPDLIDDMRRTLQSGHLLEKEARGPDGTAYLLRILPYAVPSSAAKGVVATFVDVTTFRDLQRLQAVLDALPEHVAVLNPQGTIIMVNAAWVRFARENGDPQLTYSGVRANYLDACNIGGNLDEESDARRAYLGIRSVLDGQTSAFSLKYPCHSADEQRWFIMNVAPIDGPERGAVVTHINITAWYNPLESDH
jgi:two-component system CheB/CheR fusion protein